MKRIKKKALTLLEIMIVVFLIGLIGSVIGYNMKGSLDEGKAFKTRQAQAQIRDILLLEVAKGVPVEQVVDKKRQYLANSGLVKNVSDLLKDGWGNEFEIKATSGGDISIQSNALRNYLNKKRRNLKQEEIGADEEQVAEIES
jgi:type II secretory pathway pseudopilin PulG